MEFGKADWYTFERGIEKEWLITNGIGGFSSSTMIGANTRRYHGLLIASLRPPVMRHLVLSKLDECLEINGNQYNLFSNQTPDHQSSGYMYQQRFLLDDIPTYIYNVEDTLIEKKISMVYGENTVVIVYKIIGGSKDCSLTIAPLVNFRDYHYNSSRDNLLFNETFDKTGVELKPFYSDANIFINISEGKFIKQQDIFFYNMDYAMERERGLHSIEDHYIPGLFKIDINAGETKTITVTAGVGERKQLEGMAVIQKERKRLHDIINKAGYDDELADVLVKACDQFIVKRESTESKTVIAGYPWFTDWGRDTMIALPGLTLATKRYEDAKDILYTFSRYVKDGLVPNMFPDAGQEPLYNTVDAALWFINAAYQYVKYTNDYDFIKVHVYEELKEIINCYMGGTLYNIGMDDDFLIYAGNEKTQLTWMDAKVGDWVVTPRFGKTVEINALWYNSLNIMAYLYEYYKESNLEYGKIAQKVKVSFLKEFWNQNKMCLYDVVNEYGKDDKVRPNQIFAVSLDFPVIDGSKAHDIVDAVWKQLYSTYGLRSLSHFENEYQGIYIGDQMSRDGSYHQGTAWSWPIGHFITAYRKVNNYSKESKEIAQYFIEPFKDHLKDACLGSVSEIFDGDVPNRPRGCFAQAWGVAEILRAYTEDIMEVGKCLLLPKQKMN